MKSFTKTKVAIQATVVGFGQAGSRIADVFASFKDSQGAPFYNCLALNSNQGDLDELKYIPSVNRKSLDLGGLGKNPIKAMTILEEDEKVRDNFKTFIQEQIRPKDDLVLFTAGLGGGTGTSTVVKAIEEFYEFNNKPLLDKELKKIQEQIGDEKFQSALRDKKVRNKLIAKAHKNIEDKVKKIGVIVTLPLRADGPDTLKQVNEFTQRIWSLANNPLKGVAFVLFADNQYMYDRFKDLDGAVKQKNENYRDYVNNEIANVFHEMNSATTGGGTSVTFDAQDFRRVLLENRGCLVINKKTMSIEGIREDMLESSIIDSMKDSLLHSPISLTIEENDQIRSASIGHIGLLAVLDQECKSKIGSSFLDDARIKIMENSEYALNGTVFSGYIDNVKNDRQSSIYTFYKTDGLPSRISMGLVNEYNEYKAAQKSIGHLNTSIQKIEDENEEEYEFDLGELDLLDTFEKDTDKNDKESKSTEELLSELFE